MASQIAAIGRSQAVIEFAVDGTIIHANANFLKTRRLYARRNQRQAPQYICRSRLTGKAPDYKAFWAKLGTVSSILRNTSASARAAVRSGFRPSYNPLDGPVRQGVRRHQVCDRYHR